jgi:hypothetical protein
MSGLPVPPVRGQWDNSTADAIALTECVLADDLVGAGAVLRNMDAAPVAVTAVKLLAEAIETAEAGFQPCRCHFREWALEAVRQP